MRDLPHVGVLPLNPRRLWRLCRLDQTSVEALPATRGIDDGVTTAESFSYNAGSSFPRLRNKSHQERRSVFIA